MLGFFGVFGHPIKHSKSPILHNYTFQRLSKESGLSGYYARILLEDGSALRSQFENLGLLGANITIPFKEKAFEQCDEVRGIAQEIGACNTIIKKHQTLIGYNTDADGFYECIQSFAFKNALIIGAGGSAKAIATILSHHHIPTIIINRSPQALESFHLKGFETHLSTTFTPQNPYELIINTTSAGLNDDQLPCERSLLDSLFAQAKYAFDLIYGRQTPFLTIAKDHRLQHCDGRQMLINQAVLASRLFYTTIAESDSFPQKATIASLMNEVFALQESTSNVL